MISTIFHQTEAPEQFSGSKFIGIVYFIHSWNRSGKNELVFTLSSLQNLPHNLEDSKFVQYKTLILRNVDSIFFFFVFWVDRVLELRDT